MSGQFIIAFGTIFHYKNTAVSEQIFLYENLTCNFSQDDLERCAGVLPANGSANAQAENFESSGSPRKGTEEPRIQ